MTYFLKQSEKKNGLYLQIYTKEESTQGEKNLCFKNLGYIEALKQNGIEDPISYYQKKVDELNKRNEEEVNAELKISSDTTPRRLGYFLVTKFLEKLNVKESIKSLFKRGNDDFDYYKIFEGLICANLVSRQLINWDIDDLWEYTLKSLHYLSFDRDDYNLTDYELDKVVEMVEKTRKEIFKILLDGIKDCYSIEERDTETVKDIESTVHEGMENADLCYYAVSFYAMIIERCIKHFEFDDKFDIREIEKFISGFEVVKVSDDYYINLMEMTPIVPFIKEKYGVPIDNFKLTQVDIDYLFD